jgi:hypothetical protein
MNKTTLLLALICLSPTLSIAQTPIPEAAQAPAVPAQDLSQRPEKERRTHFQALIGPAFLLTGDGGTYLNYGASLTYDLTKDQSGIFSMGLFFLTTTKSDKASGVTLDQTFTAFGLDLLARRIFDSRFYFGSRLGYTAVSANLSDSTTDLSSSGGTFGYGPVLGLEIEASDSMSFNLDVTYMVVNSGTVTGDLGTLKFNTIEAILPRLGLQFHL